MFFLLLFFSINNIPINNTLFYFSQVLPLLQQIPKTNIQNKREQIYHLLEKIFSSKKNRKERKKNTKKS